MLRKLFRHLPPEAQAPSKPVEQRPRPAPVVDSSKFRVLFLCIGNSCRSPMAEGLARQYGSDVMQAASAGVFPIHRVDPFSVKVMADRNIDISDAYPKGAEEVNPQSFDLIVNMSGQKLPSIGVPVEEWKVPDPIGQAEEQFRQTADLLEQMVMRLILQVRLKRHPAMASAPV